MLAEIRDNFYYKGRYDIPKGTLIEIEHFVEDTHSVTGKSFIVKNCDSFPILKGAKIATSLVKNPDKIIEEMKIQNLAILEELKETFTIGTMFDNTNIVYSSGCPVQVIGIPYKGEEKSLGYFVETDKGPFTIYKDGEFALILETPLYAKSSKSEQNLLLII